MPDLSQSVCRPCPFRVGEIIRERQYNGRDRTVEKIVQGEHIVTTRGGRRSRIAWKNLRRYELVGVNFVEVGDDGT